MHRGQMNANQGPVLPRVHSATWGGCALGLAPFKVVVPASLPLPEGPLGKGRRKADTRMGGQAECST